MKKISLLILSAILMLSFNTRHQDCDTYYPLQKGMRWVTNNYNAKGKLQSSSEVKVIDEVNTDNGTAYTILSRPVNDKKDTTSLTFTYSCEDNILKMDMNRLIPQKTMNGLNESMEVKIDQDELEFPSTIDIGSTLKDANINLTAYTSGIKIMDLKIKIYDRKVEKAESITTDAGTFDCLKLTYKTDLNMGFMNMTTSSIDWVSKSVGIVRSEQYDKKGKLSSYSELAEFSK